MSDAEIPRDPILALKGEEFDYALIGRILREWETRWEVIDFTVAQQEVIAKAVEVKGLTILDVECFSYRPKYEGGEIILVHTHRHGTFPIHIDPLTQTASESAEIVFRVKGETVQPEPGDECVGGKCDNGTHVCTKHDNPENPHPGYAHWRSMCPNCGY